MPDVAWEYFPCILGRTKVCRSELAFQPFLEEFMNIQRRFVQRGLTLLAVTMSVAAGLSACGGGGSGSATASSGATPLAAAAGTTSSGVITAFGSVFVGGHEFDTRSATLIDDDNTTRTVGASDLEVGMVIDVKPSNDSSSSAPRASELHIHPLARGYVDAADTTLGTLQVMGQAVQLTSSTNISDHRACVSATPATCTAISTPAGLSVTTAPAAPGSYVAVHGYLYGSGGTANIVATLVSVADVPTSTTGVNFKAEGVVTVGASSTTIGGLTLDLSSAPAVCRVSGATQPCATAFTTGQVVSAGSALAPTLPATTLVATVARLASKTSVDSAGAAVEMEGVVSSAGTTSFVARGVMVDTSALTSALPAVGDVVRVLGAVSANGQTITASNVVILHAASSVKVGLEGDASAVAAGSAANTYTLSVLGQTVTVNAKTRLMDMSVRGWDRMDHNDPTVKSFNITTFATYMAASASSHVIAKTETDASGNLIANSLTIVPASSITGVAGLVDASPAVVNSAATGTPSTLSVHGIAINVDPVRVLVHGHSSGLNPISAGDQVVALGTWSGSTLTISATVSNSNQLFDAGVPHGDDRGEF
jgi:hypothetical protein